MLSCDRLSNAFSELSLASALTKAGARSTATSETRSEISSADSDWSDIRAIALKLGVNNPDDLHTERFKVDRSKLEQLIKTESSIENKNGAEYFFDHVMRSYNTHISWPCKLKIGAKSKKDPHVRIVGKTEEVLSAKKIILESLESRVSRVIMKIDVSYTDHSFIIGRGGNNIKSIMEETTTHIHFPDSNRSHPTEKSNQVSLCGSLEGVERARALVRLSTPLLISFELPIMGPGCQQPDQETPFVKMIQAKYNVQTIFSTRPKLHAALVSVKGPEKSAMQVLEATQMLINFTCENMANQMLVNMQLEISPQHHEVVKGKNNAHLLDIMERTQTKIIFPDLTDMNIKPLKKSQINITGTLKDVYNARQQLLGNLPIVLIFDYPDNQSNASDIMNLSTKYGVHILLRQKQRQSTLAVVIKGVEKFVNKIYEARQEILKLNTPLVKPLLPESYFSTMDHDYNLGFRTMLVSLLAGKLDNQQSKLCNNMYSTQGNNNNINSNANFNKIYSKVPPTAVCAPTQKYLQMHNNNFVRQQQQQQQQQQNNINFMQVATINQNNNNNNSAGMQQHSQQQQQQQNTLSPRNSCHNTSGYQSFSSSTTSLEQICGVGMMSHLNMNMLGGGDGNVGSCMQGKQLQYSPDSSFNSDLATRGRLGRRSSDGVLLGLGSGSGLTSIPSVPGSAESYRNLSFDTKNKAFDYDAKRVMGFKAMERAPVSGEVRTPNSHWLGLGLSHTSPAPLETAWQHNGSALNNNALNGPGGSNQSSGTLTVNYGLSATTGIMDTTPTNRRLQLTKHKDIHSLLTTLGLEHYIKIFVLNEIDLEIFTTLTEENLMELGITAFGARRKLMVAIHTLQANDNATVMQETVNNNNNNNNNNNSNTSGNIYSPRFSGSAAPGAERRPSNQW